MAGELHYLISEIETQLIPLLEERGFVLFDKTKGVEIWHFRRAQHPISDQGPFDAMDVFFSGKVEKPHRAAKSAEVEIVIATFSDDFLAKALTFYKWQFLDPTAHTQRVGVSRLKRVRWFDWMIRNHHKWEPFSMDKRVPAEKRKEEAAKVAAEVVATLPQIDAWFRDGTLGPNLSLTMVDLKFAR